MNTSVRPLSSRNKTLELQAEPAARANKCLFKEPQL